MRPIRDQYFPGTANDCLMHERIYEWSRWYSGDPGKLSEYYRNRTNDSVCAQMYWAKLNKASVRAMHVPLVGDIANVTSQLLFGEQVEIEATPEFERWEIEHNLEAKLTEAADVAAGLGGVWLKVNQDSEIHDDPLLQIVWPTSALGKWKSGVLVEAIFFWDQGQAEGSGEGNRREVLVEHRDKRTLAITIERWEMRPEGVGYNPLKKIETVKSDQLPSFGVTYVPCVRPNRLIAGRHDGIVAYHGSLNLLDALDEAYSSWWRDIRQAATRIMVPQEFLKSKATYSGGIGGSVSADFGKMGEFDDIAHSFIGLPIDQMMRPDSKSDPAKVITILQGTIRADDHKRSIDDIIQQIAGRAGFSASTFTTVESQGRAESGTAIRLRERKSLGTRDKYARYWKPAIKQVASDVLTWMGKSAGAPANVEFPEAIQQDQVELAQTVSALRSAEAASLKTAIKMLHPDWDEAAVTEEIAAIQAERAIREPFAEPGGETIA